MSIYNTNQAAAITRSIKKATPGNRLIVRTNKTDGTILITSLFPCELVAARTQLLNVAGLIVTEIEIPKEASQRFFARYY